MNDGMKPSSIWSSNRTATQHWTIPGHSRGVASLTSDSFGLVLVSGDGAGIVRVHDVKTRRMLAGCTPHAGPVWNVALCHRRREIAIAGPRGAIATWDATGKLPNGSVEARSRRILSMQYRAKDQALVWVGVEGRVFQSDPSQGKSPEQLYDHGVEIESAYIDAAGRWLAVGDRRRNLELLDCRNGFSRRRLDGHRRSVSSLVVHPDGRLLASGGRDCAIRIWETESARQILVLRGHMAPVLSLCFSPNGLSLASGDATGSVILWEVTTGAQLAQFCVPPPASADVLAFAGGEILAAGGTGSDIHLWDLSALLRRKSI